MGHQQAPANILDMKSKPISRIQGRGGDRSQGANADESIPSGGRREAAVLSPGLCSLSIQCGMGCVCVCVCVFLLSKDCMICKSQKCPLLLRGNETEAQREEDNRVN